MALGWRVSSESMGSTQKGNVVSVATGQIIAPLTNADRCDRCGAAAQMAVIFPNNSRLYFCQHHAKEHGPKLMVIDGIKFFAKKAEDQK